MISQSEQSDLIKEIYDLGGLAYESSDNSLAAEGDLRIDLAEAMNKSKHLRLKIANYIVSELEEYRVNMVVSVGKAVSLGRAVAAIGDFEFVGIDSSKGDRKRSKINKETRGHINEYSTRFAYVECVSGAWRSTKRFISRSNIKDPEVAISAWRRGVDRSGAAVGLTVGGKPPIELSLNYPVAGVIERPVPLGVRGLSQAELWIPEIGQERQPKS